MSNCLTEKKVWQKIEIVLNAENSYKNPYKEVDVWVDLAGPGFKKRVYGFWDGGDVFRVRITATSAGEWNWSSCSNQRDPGLNGKTGSFQAVNWSEEELAANSCRRGLIRASEDGHSLDYADGTPCFLIGDTWWATPTYRYKWYDDEKKRPIGPEMGFKDMVCYRKEQGYNLIAMIAAHPTWANDDYPERVTVDDKEDTVIRAAWRQAGTDSAEDMYNEGGRPFEFPGKVMGYEDIVPDLDRVNPEYFKHMDKKIDYLNEKGFIPFIEVSRRDISQVWKKYYDWPASYGRYINYVFSRYHANNCIFSPIHFDWSGDSIPSREFNEPIKYYIEKYNKPPFGTLLSTNAHMSNLRNFGGPDENDWLDLYQTGNWRAHCNYWYLTEMFKQKPTKPALNGEPYYAGCALGWPQGEPPEDKEEDALYCRSGMYGSVLSGGLAGHIYGAQGIWEGAIEKEADPTMWDALKWQSGNQMQYLSKFVLSEGARYKDLIPDSEYIMPSKNGESAGYKGWAYCAGTEEKDFFLLYFEKDCPEVIFRGAFPGKEYRAYWFNPRNGEWKEFEEKLIPCPETGLLDIPEVPSNNDWGMKLLEIK